MFHPPYSPYLILCDFLFVCLFVSGMKSVLKGKGLADMEKMEQKIAGH